MAKLQKTDCTRVAKPCAGMGLGAGQTSGHCQPPGGVSLVALPCGRRYTVPMNLTRALLAGAAACLVCVSAAAQWQWLDKDGRKVFSDRPPPADIPAKNILKQPGKPKVADVAPMADAAASAASGSKGAASGPRVAGVDKELEAKKKAAADAEAAKKKADEDKVAKQMADNCTRARQGKATLDSGVRMSTVNAAGEREIMDEAARAAESQRIQGIIAENCK
jgi:hypothetical protein